MFIARLPLYRKLSGQRSSSIASKVSPLLPDSGRLLDFGCGNMYTALSIAEAKPELQITGLDVIEDENLQKNITAQGRVSFKQYDGEAVPFEDNSFDAALASSAMHHTHSPEYFLEELKRVVKPDGFIVLVEEMYLNLPDKLLISAQDWTLNKMKKGVPVPLNFRSHKHYLKLFKEKRLEAVYEGSIRPCPPYIHHYVYQLRNIK